MTRFEDMLDFEIDALWQRCPPGWPGQSRFAFLNLDGSIDTRWITPGARRWRVPVPVEIKLMPFLDLEPIRLDIQEMIFATPVYVSPPLPVEWSLPACREFDRRELRSCHGPRVEYRSVYVEMEAR